MKKHISQKDGQIIPTPHGSILHPSRPSQMPYKVKNRFLGRSTKIWKFLWKFHFQLLASPIFLAKYWPPAALWNDWEPCWPVTAHQLLATRVEPHYTPGQWEEIQLEETEPLKSRFLNFLARGSLPKWGLRDMPIRTAKMAPDASIFYHKFGTNPIKPEKLFVLNLGAAWICVKFTWILYITLEISRI